MCGSTRVETEAEAAGGETEAARAEAERKRRKRWKQKRGRVLPPFSTGVTPVFGGRRRSRARTNYQTRTLAEAGLEELAADAAAAKRPRTAPD
jgi:hypothetical protein